MNRVYQNDAFKERVDFAVRHISRGAAYSRTFDTCFEMHDGDAVAVAVLRRSWRNQRLRRNLFKYLGRDSVIATAWQNRRRPTKTLSAWAAELRAEAERNFDDFMASRSAV